MASSDDIVTRIGIEVGGVGATEPGTRVVVVVVVGVFSVLVLALVTAVVVGMGETVDDVLEVVWMMVAAGAVVLGMVLLVAGW
jgi:predicted permease